MTFQKCVGCGETKNAPYQDGLCDWCDEQNDKAYEAFLRSEGQNYEGESSIDAAKVPHNIGL